MKRLLFLLLAAMISLNSRAIGTTYYNVANSGSLENVNNWGTNTDGSGSHPAGFALLDVFNLYNGTTASITGDWAIVLATLNVGDGTHAINFTIPSAFNITFSGISAINVSANATVTIFNTTNPTYGTVSTGSTINYALTTGGQAAANITYGNLIFSNTSGRDSITAATSALTLTTTAGGTVNLQANAMTSLTSVTNNGTLLTSNTSSTPFPTGLTWGGTGTLAYKVATGGQTVMAGTYNCSLSMGNTSGTNTASGVITANSGLTTTAGGTLAMGTNQLLGATIVPSNSGTLTTLCTANPALPSTAATWGGTVTYGATTGAQFIGGNTYNNLNLLNSSGTNTATGNVSVNGALVTTSFGTLDMTTFKLGGAPTSVTNNGAIKTASTNNPAIPTGQTWTGTTGTVTFTSTTGGQFIPAGTFKTLTCSNTSGTDLAVGALSVSTSLVTTAGGTLDMGANLLSGAFTPTNNGTINTQNTSSTPIPTGKTWAGTVNYNAATGGQTVVSATSYVTLTSGNTSGTNTSAGNLSLTTLNTTASGTLDMGTNVISAVTTITNNGNIQTENTSATPFPTSKTWGGIGSLIYNVATGGQTLMLGTYNCSLAFNNTSGTNTAAGQITANAGLTTTAGGTLDMSTFQLIGTIVPTNNGTISTQCATSPAIPSGKTWGGTINFYSTTGTQGIPAGTFNNLTFNNSGSTATAAGIVTVNGALTTTSGGTLAMSTFQLAGTPTSVTNNGAVTTSSTASPAIPSGQNWTGTTGSVTFGAATGGQFVPAGTYKTLTFSNTAGTNTATGNVTVTTTLTANSTGGTLDMSTFSLGGALTTLTSTGTIKTQNTGSTPLPSGFALGGTVNYYATTGGQTVVPETSYTNLACGNTSGTNTAGGNLVVNGTLTTTANGILSMTSAYTLGGTLTTITNNGVIQTAVPTSTSATPLPSGKTWGGTGTVEYNAATGAQTIMDGTYTCNLKLSNTSGTSTANGNIVANSGLTTTANGTLDMTAAYTLTGTLSTITNNGIIKTSVPTATSATPLASGKTWGGTGTVVYAATTGAQTVMAGTYSCSLQQSNTSGTNTASGVITLNGGLTTAAGGTLDMSTFAIAGTPTSVSSSGVIQTKSTTNPAIPTGQTWGGSVVYYATTGAQFIPAGTFNNLTFSNTSGNQTANGALTVNGILTTTSGGTLLMGANQLSGTMTAVNNGAVSTASTANPAIPAGLDWTGTTGTVTFAAITGGQFIPSGTYKTLACSNTSNTNTATGNLTVTTTLTANSGASATLDLGTNTLGGALTTLNNSGTIKTQNTSSTPLPSGLSISGIVNYYATTGAQTVVAETSYGTLTLSNTSGTNTSAGNLSLTTLNTTANGILDMGTNAISSVTTIVNNGVIQTENTSATPFPAGKTWGGSGTVNYNATTGGQTVMAGTYTCNLQMGNTSGTNTASGVLTVNGGLSTTATGTLDMSTFALAGIPASVSNNGTIQTKSTTNPAIPSGQTWGGSVIFYTAAGGQTIPTGTYNNLSVNNTSGTETASGALVVNGSLTTTSGGTLAMGANQLSGSMSVTNNGAITTASTANPAIPSGLNWTGTTGSVAYTLAAGGQYVPQGTYQTLTFANTSGTNNATGDIAVTTALTTSGMGGTLNMGTNLLSGAFTPTNTGTLQTQNTSSAPIPSGDTWAGTVEYNGTGAQTMVAGTFNNLKLSTARTGSPAITLASGTINLSGNFTVSATGIGSYVVTGNTFNYSKTTGGQAVGQLTYNNLTLSNTSGTNTAGGAINVNGALTTTSGGILDMSSYALGGTPTAITNDGTITTSSTNNPAIPAGQTWTGTTGLVKFALSTGSQYVPLGTYKSLTLGNTSGADTATGNITVGTTLITTAGGTLYMGASNILSGAGAFTNGGTIITLVPTSVSSTPIPSGIAWGGTIVYGATTGKQTIVAETSYTNLTLSNTTDTNSAAGNTVVNGTLTTTAGGVTDMRTFTLGGTLGTITGGGTIRTANTAAAPLKSGQTWPQSIEYYSPSGGQTIVAGTYSSNLTNSNTSGTNTMAGVTNVGGNLTLNAGSTLSDNGNTLTLSGNISGTGTHTGTGKITMIGSGATISGVTLGNLTLNNAAGFSLTGSPQINGTLTLSSGVLSTGSNNLTFGVSATTAGSPSSSNMIIANTGGRILKDFSSTGSFTFPIGDNTLNYTPLTLNVTSGTFGAGAYAGVTVTASKHPANANTTNYLNRYWSINTSGITSPVYMVAATYVPADVTGTEASISAASYPGSLPWTKYSATNTTTHTLSTTSVASASVDISGISSILPSLTLSTSTTICPGGNASLSVLSSAGDAALSYIWSPSGSLSATTGTSAVATPTVTTVYTVTITDGNGLTGIGTTTVTVTPLPAALPTNNGYICNGGTVTLSANPIGGTTTYAWSGSSLSSTTAQNPTATPVATSTYSLTVTDGTTNSGCSSSYTTSVTVNSKPIATPTNNGPICTGGTVNLTANPAQGANTYNWTGTSLSSSTAQNPTATIAATSVYTLTVSDGSGQPGCAPSTQYTTSVTVSGQPTVNISASTIGQICPAVVETLTATPSGGAGTPTYTWSGPGITTPASSGSVASYTVVPVPAYSMVPVGATGAYTVSLSYSASGCNAATSVSGTVSPTMHRWIGGDAGGPTDWNNTNNWVCGAVPVTTDNILIPAGGNQPVILASASGTVNDLYIDPSASITLNSSSVLNIKGNFTNNGVVSNTSTSQIKLNGTTAQTIKGSNTLYNLELNNSAGASIVNATDTLLIKGTLTLTAGTLNTNNVVMLYSDASGTGRIGTITGGSISGNVIVQQYVQGGRRAYRFWGHPFSIAIALQQLETYIDISGPGGADNGFTTTAFNTPSAYWYNPLYGNSSLTNDPGWRGFTDPYLVVDSNKFKQYEGIRVFIRGTKNEGLFGETYVPDPVTVRMYGPINTGTQNIPLVKGSSTLQDYNLLSNPFPSPINLGAIVKRAYDSGKLNGGSYYVYNPYLGTSGAFQTLPIDGSNYYLEANASFEVRTLLNGNTLNIAETDKSSSITTTLLRSQPQYITLEINDTTGHPWDMLYVRFGAMYTDKEDNQYDGGKITSSADLSFYSFSADGAKLALDCRPYTSGEVIPLGIISDSKQPFVIRAKNIDAANTGKIYLHDKYLNIFKLLNEGAEYRFDITGDSASQGDNRFELLMNDKPVITGNTNNQHGIISSHNGISGNEPFTVSLLPNPATDMVNVVCKNVTGAVKITVVDMQGIEVINNTTTIENQGQASLNLHTLAAGVYLINVTSGGNTIVERLIKQ